MYKNKIKQLRDEKEITQQELAEEINCTKQYIQRIEGGHEAVKIDIACEICNLLNCDLEVVFPGLKEVIKNREKKEELFQLQLVYPKKGRVTKKIQKKNNRCEERLEDAEFIKGTEQAGIDMSPETHYFKYKLRGGAEGIFEITTQEENRFWRNFQEYANAKDSDTPFVTVNSGGWCNMINLDHLIFVHLLGYGVRANKEDAYGVEIFFANSPAPEMLEMEEDEPDPADPDLGGQMVAFISAAETMVEEKEFFTIVDSDGETALLRAYDIAMIKIPMWVFNPDLEPPKDDEPA
jgi:DNA-binding XRE family transcriptional regulator